MAVINLSIAYENNISKVTEIIKEVVDSMKKSGKITITELPQIFSINDLTLNSVSIIVKIKSEPGKQWGIEREFRTLIKERFEEENILFAAQRVSVKNI